MFYDIRDNKRRKDMKTVFLDLGRQPIANGFVKIANPVNEYFFDLRVLFDDDTYLVSLEEFVPPEKMFNEEYVYKSSMSRTMQSHFEKTANNLKKEFNPQRSLEIGSNDGVFVSHFNANTTIAVEPCGNFAKITNELGYSTYPEFWTFDLAEKILCEHGSRDLIFSANCMCHIGNIQDAFKAVEHTLSDNGVFVFEDPSLLKMIERGSYDQIYDEHAHIFSVLSIDKLLKEAGLEIFRVKALKVHGGSNRFYVKKLSNNNIEVEQNVYDALKAEKAAGLADLITYQNFSIRVEKSKKDLLKLLHDYKLAGKKIVSYGGTSKSTTVFNYCGIGPDLIDYVVDTTLDKQNKFSPGVHIPVVSPEAGFDESVEVAFLGAWNYEEEILQKEVEYLARGGVFVTHVPSVRAL